MIFDKKTALNPIKICLVLRQERKTVLFNCCTDARVTKTNQRTRVKRIICNSFVFLRVHGDTFQRKPHLLLRNAFTAFQYSSRCLIPSKFKFYFIFITRDAMSSLFGKKRSLLKILNFWWIWINQISQWSADTS